MATFDTPMETAATLKRRSQAVTWIVGVIVTAAAVVLAAWVVLAVLAGTAAPEAGRVPFSHEQLRQHVLRENGFAPAAAPIPAAESVEMLRRHLLLENGIAPAAETYADYGQRHGAP